MDSPQPLCVVILIPLIVFNLNEEGNILGCFNGEGVGTMLVHCLKKMLEWQIININTKGRHEKLVGSILLGVSF